MINSTLLDSKTVNLNEVFSNGKTYKVPQFQRDYSWEEDNWEDLWNDVIYAFEQQKIHYMGAVVLQVNNKKEYAIIDGQQRFTTLALLIIAIVKNIKDLAINNVEPEANIERADLLFKQYIGQKNPSSLKYSSRLFLNENNDALYQQRIINFEKPVSIAKLNDSEKLLWNAYEYFLDKVKIYAKSKDGAFLAALLNDGVGEQLRFIQIVVEDELNAYTVFETLNSRGVDLSPTDLLKNYLFSLVAKSGSDINIVRNQWKKIIEIVGLKGFPTFLRYFLNSRTKNVSKNNLFKTIKSKYDSDIQVFTLLDELEDYAYIYKALETPDDDLWLGKKEIIDCINVLKSFRVVLYKPLLMISYKNLGENDFKRLLKTIVNISFRYNVIGKLQTNEMEVVYNKAAFEVFEQNIKDVKVILGKIKPLYIENDEFQSHFELREFNTNNSQHKKIVRYILCSIEAQYPKGNKYDFELDEGTIEHILPEKDFSQYPDFDEESHQKYVFRLGNLTLLETSKNNKEAATKSIIEKIAIFQSSKYGMSNSINVTNWNSKQITHRQAELAKKACGVWTSQFV